MNVHYDYIELKNFYRGYMGRRLLIQEGRLLTRGHEEKVKQKVCFFLFQYFKYIFHF